MTCLLLPIKVFPQPILPVCEGRFGEGSGTLLLNSAPVQTARGQSILGANALYAIEDDQAWSGDLAKKLRTLKISSLRFPGGEVADWYDWERSLNAPEMLPFTDYREFLERAKEVGADALYFVVNLESAFLLPGDREANVHIYAEKAARWVAEVKRQGYKVKYWEIGNESYLPGTTYSLTAAEYAEALSIFSRAMKKADPEIVIAANGPSGANGVGFADKFERDQLAFIRGEGRAVCGKKPEKDCVEKVRRVIPGTAQPQPWWEVVATIAGNDFDMAVVHSYSSVTLPRATGETNFRETNVIGGLRERLVQMTGRQIEISVTEWNVPPERRKRMSAEEAVFSNIIKLGNYKAVGVEHAHFWPLRYPKREGAERALLTMDKLDETPMYRALEFVMPVMNADYVRQSALEDGVYALIATASSGEKVLLVNERRGARKIGLQLQDGSRQGVRVMHYSAGRRSEGAACVTSDGKGKIVVNLPPASLTTIMFVH